MSTIHCILHSPTVSAGTIPDWAAARGHVWIEHDAHLGAPLPSPAADEPVFLMGGPMGVTDAPDLPWLSTEISWLEQLVARRQPLLGICLGAQMLAAALGGHVRAQGFLEVGWWPVHRSDSYDTHAADPDHPAWLRLPDRLVPFLWHGDAFSLPDGVPSLASSEACPNQLFATAGGRIVGIQFHPEFRESDLHSLVEATPMLDTSGRWVQAPTDFLGQAAPLDAMRRWLWTLLDDFIESLGVGARADARGEREVSPG